MYDFAGTTFAMNVITLYFALWVTVDMHHQDIYYSLSYSGSMLFSALLAPLMGAISDRLHKRMPFLIVLTLITCLFTALISITNHFYLALFFFAIANFCFQLGDIIYNALLPDVSDNRNIGKVSGIGKSFAYLGTIAGLLIISPFAIRYGRHATFFPSAMLFLFFSLPCFIVVKDRKRFQLLKRKINWSEIVRHSINESKKTVSNIQKYKGLGSFLLTIFLAFNAINTIFIFMSVYTKKMIGFNDGQIIFFYIVSSAFAAAGSFLSGYITDKFGAKRTLAYSLWLWLIALMVIIFTQNKIIFWMIGPLVGVSMGATWTSARTVATHLAPKEMMGEIFGFYGLVIKIGAIFGPLIWGAIILAFGFIGMAKYHIAVGALAIFIISSLITLRHVPNQ